MPNSSLIRQKPLVLLVDDNENLRVLYTEYLKTSGYDVDVISVGTIEEALKAFTESSPDAAIIDLRLSGRDDDGLILIDSLGKIDPTTASFILTGHASLDTAKRSVGQKNITRYLTKPPVLTDMLTTLKNTVERTGENRAAYLQRFPSLYNPHSGRNIIPIKADDEMGRWLKIFHDRISLGKEFGFTEDSKGGVSTFAPIEQHTTYHQDTESYVIKKYDSEDELKAAIENSGEYSEPGKLKHPKPTLFYPDQSGAYYALVPLVFGPNFGQVFSIINSIDDSDQNSGRARNIKNSILGVNVDVMVYWHESSVDKGKVKVGDIEKTKVQYANNLERSLSDLHKQSIDDRIRDIVGKELKDLRKRNYRALTPSKIEQFMASLDAFSHTAPYETETNVKLYSRLMDLSPQNSGLEMGVLIPTCNQFFELFREIKDENLPDFIRKRYVVFDSHYRIGHIFEDFVHFFHSPEANLSLEEKISYFRGFVGKRFNGANIDTSKLWMAYVLVGLYKSIRKQNLILTLYSKRNKGEYEVEKRIGQPEYQAKAEAYARKAKHWGMEAVWFATVAHLITELYQRERLDFELIANTVERIEISQYSDELRHKKLPRSGRGNSLPYKMLYLFKFCDNHCVPTEVLV